MKSFLLSGLLIIMAFTYSKGVTDKDHSSPPGTELVADQMEMQMDQVAPVADMEILMSAPVELINDYDKPQAEISPSKELLENTSGTITGKPKEGHRSVFRQEKGTSFDRWCTGTYC